MGGNCAGDSAMVPKGLSGGRREIETTGGSVRRRGGAEPEAAGGEAGETGAGVAAGTCARRVPPARTPEPASPRKIWSRLNIEVREV